jgi:thiol-disulfide isomerase/thioredoxin
MKRLIGLLVIVLSIFLVHKICYSGESFDLNIPPSARADGSVSQSNSAPAQTQQNDSRPAANEGEDLNIPADYSLTFKSLDGKTLRMSDYKGKYLFLNFWATWCPPCRGEMPGIQSLYNEVKGNNVAFICASDEKVSTVSDFVKANNYTFPIYTYNGSLPQLYEIRGIPTTFIISKEGKIIAKYVGGYFSDPHYISHVKYMLTHDK